MWQPLLPLLADKYHLIAPDYPGFGNSSAPYPTGFEYTFDNIARVMNELTTRLGIANYILFMQDYGGPSVFAWCSPPSFTVAGATAYADDVPGAEIHILEAGHFALDEATDEIALIVRNFLAQLDQQRAD
jgi:pimeloyl-ACP methyl ester carboxylesterase